MDDVYSLSREGLRYDIWPHLILIMFMLHFCASFVPYLKHIVRILKKLKTKKFDMKHFQKNRESKQYLEVSFYTVSKQVGRMFKYHKFISLIHILQRRIWTLISFLFEMQTIKLLNELIDYQTNYRNPGSHAIPPNVNLMLEAQSPVLTYNDKSPPYTSSSTEEHFIAVTVTSNKKSTDFLLINETPISILKHFIASWMNININAFYLHHNGKSVNEYKKMKEIFTEDSNEIEVVIRGKGGSPTACYATGKTSFTQNCGTFQGRYSNLNLTKNAQHLDNKCTESITDDLAKKKNDDNRILHLNEKERKSNSYFWNDSSKYANNLIERKNISLPDEQINLNSKINNSTLSLHIAAYENGIHKDSPQNFKEKFLKANSLITSFNDVKRYEFYSVIKDPFEFPRQENDKEATPEIAQFKATQRLLHPNNTSVSSYDFFANSLKKLEKQTGFATASSRKTSSISQSPVVPPAKKPRFNAYYHKDKFSDILAKAAPSNPYILENARLKDALSERNEEVENLKKKLKEANSQINKFEKESNYSSCGDRRQQKIISDEIHHFQSKYGDSATEVVSRINSYFQPEGPIKFSPALTSHIFQASGITLNKARKLRREFNFHNAPDFLASERKVNEEKKKIREGIEFEELYVKLRSKAGAEPETKLVTILKNPGGYTQQRLQGLQNNKNFRKIFYQGREEIWLALTIDKALARTTLGLIIGNTLKRINSAYNISFLGIYEADDSSYNMNAAFAKIFKLLGDIKEITLRNDDGTTVTLPVRWFYVADYKSEKGVFGLMGGNPTYPSIKCLSKMQETYGELDFTKKCDPRPEGFHVKYCQERPSLAPFIPASHFIPPPLHMTMGPGAQLFEYLFELVGKLDAARGDVDQAYHLLKENPNWKKKLRESYAEIQVMQDELKDIEETAELYSALLSSTTNERKLKTCSLNSDCVVKLMKQNVPSHFISCCNDCSKLVHRCCRNVDLSCPHCVPFQPTAESGKSHLMEEQDLINVRIGELIIAISEKEILFREEMQKLRPGALTKILEKVLEKHGGSRKAFFQKYSGAHLVKMGNNMDKIIEDLPAEVTSDEKVTVTLQAIKLFFEAKKAMKSGLEMSDEEIELMKIKVIEFGTFMKNNLGSLKTKQKGHLFLFEAPEFGEMFKTCSFFSDEAIEAHNAVTNEQEKRIKCKKSPKRYSTLLKWGIYNNYYYDNISCKDYKE